MEFHCVFVTFCRRSAVTHSDEEDSAESTTDEENVEENSVIDPTEDKLAFF